MFLAKLFVKRRVWLGVVLASRVISVGLAAPSPQLINPHAIDMGLRLTGSASLSPDGRLVILSTSKGNGYLDLHTGKVAEFPSGPDAYAGVGVPQVWGGPPSSGLSAGEWSPRGDYLAMTVYTQGRRKLKIWPAGMSFDSPQARDIFVPPRSMGFSRPVWSPDQKTLYMVVSQYLMKEKLMASQDNPPNRSLNVELSLSGTYDDSEEFVNAPKLYPDAYAEGTRSVVVAIDIATGKIGMLAKGNDIDYMYLSPDGRTLAIVQGKSNYFTKVEHDPKKDFEQYRGDVYLIDTGKGDSLPGIDLESMEDRTAGWSDARGRRPSPVLTNIETNTPGAFTPEQDFPTKGTGTSGSPPIVWAPDSSAFVYATVGRYATGDIFIYDLKQRKARNLTEKVPPLDPKGKGPGYFSNQRSSWSSPKFGGIFSPLWLPDGKTLLVTARGNVWRVAADGAYEPRNLTRDFDQEIIRMVAAPGRIQPAVDAAGRVVVLSRDRMTRYDTVWKLDPETGNLSKIADTGVCTNMNLDTDVHGKYLVYTGQSITSLPNIYRLDLSGSATAPVQPEYLTRYRLDLNDQVYPESRVLSWTTSDGYVGYGLLYLPPGASPNNKVPLVFSGYPSESVSKPDKRAYAGAGFYDESLDAYMRDGIAFLYADIPMSDQGAYEQPMKQIVNAVNGAVDAALATGYIDEKRMGVMGISYGGYMVNAMLSQTDRFKVGVSIAGMSDAAAFNFGNSVVEPYDSVELWASWAEYRQGRIGKKLWEAPERYLENSPLVQWDKVKAPLLLIHGGFDYVVKPFFGEESFKGLKYQNKPAIYAYYPRMMHSVYGDINSPGNTDVGRRIRGWFREHLLGKPSITQFADQGSFVFGSEGGMKLPDAPAAAPEPSSETSTGR